MNQNIESKLRGWTTIIIAFGWTLAVILCILGILSENIFLLIMCIAGAADVLIIGYFTARLTTAFADITESTRESAQALAQLNTNLQKIYLDDIKAADRAEAEKERMERERAEWEKKEKERIEAEKKQEAVRRKEVYWKVHAKEKEALLAKREQAQRALNVGDLGAKEMQELKALILLIDNEFKRDR